MPSLLVALIPIAVVLATALFALIRARRHTRKPRDTREPSGFVILEGNLWDACTVDDLREPWARFTTEPVRGFCGVPSGRHRIRTTTAMGEATLDFVVYPGEVMAWRLDAERTRWEPHDLDADTRSVLEASPPASTESVSTQLVGRRAKLPGWLVHLRTTMNIGSSRSGASLSQPRGAGEDGVDRLRKRVGKLVGLAEADADSDVDLVAEARAIGEALIGRPLGRREMKSLVASARDTAQRLTEMGDVDRAMRVLALGLAVLPGDPELMVTAGCALAVRGEADEALRALSAALERDRCLDAEDVARAMRARMEIRSRLGRSVRV